MSTRATIRFKDKYSEYYIHRSHDGFPDIVEADIREVLCAKKDKWDDPECSLLATCFVGWFFNKMKRIPDYVMTHAFHGDESYLYFVDWNEKLKIWTIKTKMT